MKDLFVIGIIFPSIHDLSSPHSQSAPISDNRLKILFLVISSPFKAGPILLPLPYRIATCGSSESIILISRLHNYTFSCKSCCCDTSINCGGSLIGLGIISNTCEISSIALANVFCAKLFFFLSFPSNSKTTP